MKIVIEISEEDYKLIKSYGKDSTNYRISLNLYDAVKNGTPLPKGHSRLIILSEDAVKREQTPLNFSYQNWISEVGLSNSTVAIIEADTEVNKE